MKTPFCSMMSRPLINLSNADVGMLQLFVAQVRQLLGHLLVFEALEVRLTVGKHAQLAEDLLANEQHVQCMPFLGLPACLH